MTTQTEQTTLFAKTNLDKSIDYAEHIVKVLDENVKSAAKRLDSARDKLEEARDDAFQGQELLGLLRRQRMNQGYEPSGQTCSQPATGCEGDEEAMSAGPSDYEIAVEYGELFSVVDDERLRTDDEQERFEELAVMLTARGIDPADWEEIVEAGPTETIEPVDETEEDPDETIDAEDDADDIDFEPPAVESVEAA